MFSDVLIFIVRCSILLFLSKKSAPRLMVKGSVRMFLFDSET